MKQNITVLLGLACMSLSAVTIACDEHTDTPQASHTPQNIVDKKISHTSPQSKNLCKVAIAAGDTMAFDTKNITIPKDCADVTITFTNTGSLPVAAMGHNVVIAKKSDAQELAAEGMSAGAKYDFLPPHDSRILAKTNMIGGGEKTSVTFSTSIFDKNEQYEFFCSFPGHYFSMKGSIIVEH